MKKSVLVLSCLLCLSSAPAIAKDYINDIKFTFKEPEVSLSGGVVRGDRDVYCLNGQKGCRLLISFSSLENNGALEVSALADGVNIAGSVEQTSDGFNWIGVLPVSGAYRIVISSCRGNLTYRAKVAVYE